MSFLKKKVLFILGFCLISSIFACKTTTVNNVSESKNAEVIKESETESEVENIDVGMDVLSIDSVDISDVEDGKTYQTIKYAKVTYKNNSALQSSLNKLNSEMKKAAEDFKRQNRSSIREYIRENPDMHDAEYSHTSDISFTRNDNKYLSLTEFVYENTMGAHGMYTQSGHTYDVKTGKKKELIDFIKDKEELRAFLKNWLSEHANDIGAFDNASETIDSYIDGKYPLQFFITNELTVMFQPYDIAPYAAGLIEIPVDDDLLKESLNDF